MSSRLEHLHNLDRECCFVTLAEGDRLIAAAKQEIKREVAEALTQGVLGRDYMTPDWGSVILAAARELSPPVPPAVPTPDWSALSHKLYDAADCELLRTFARAVVAGEVVISPGGKK